VLAAGFPGLRKFALRRGLRTGRSTKTRIEGRRGCGLVLRTSPYPLIPAACDRNS